MSGTETRRGHGRGHSEQSVGNETDGMPWQFGFRAAVLPTSQDAILLLFACWFNDYKLLGRLRLEDH